MHADSHLRHRKYQPIATRHARKGSVMTFAGLQEGMEKGDESEFIYFWTQVAKKYRAFHLVDISQL
jgi:hypothetical protein